MFKVQHKSGYSVFWSQVWKVLENFKNCSFKTCAIFFQTAQPDSQDLNSSHGLSYLWVLQSYVCFALHNFHLFHKNSANDLNKIPFELYKYIHGNQDIQHHTVPKKQQKKNYRKRKLNVTLRVILFEINAPVFIVIGWFPMTP